MEEERTIETLMQDVIMDELESLRDMKVGTDEYKTTVDGVTKLMDKAIELDRFQMEFNEKVENRKRDDEMKLEQIKEEKKDRLFRNCISVAGIVIPSVITVWGTLKSFKFEETGTVTTIMGRGFINKLLPKK